MNEQYLRSLPTNELRIRKAVLGTVVKIAQDENDPMIEGSHLLSDLDIVKGLLEERDDYDPATPLELDPKNKRPERDHATNN